MADPYLRVHAVNIYVKDQARSLDFYLNTLGFHIAFDARVGPGERLLAVAPPDGSAVLTLIEVKSDSPQARLVGRATQVVFVTEDLPATYTEWRRRGVRFRNAPRLRRVVYDRTGDAADRPSAPSTTGRDRSAWGGAFTRFEDVDRNSFALVSFDEVSRAVEAQRRAAAEKQEAEQRAAHELEIAMQVQARLFPQRLPPMRTLEYAGACVQTRRVGGDYYDFLDLGQDRLGLVIGDIAGKGMPAALLMANLQANLRSQCATAVEQPERFLQTVNRLFYESTGRQCLRDVFLLGVRRPGGTPALRELRTSARAGAATRRRRRTARADGNGAGHVLHVGVPDGGAPAFSRRSSGDLHRWDHRGLRCPGRRVRGRTARRGAARASRPAATRSDRRRLRRRPPLQSAGTTRRHDPDCREVPQLLIPPRRRRSSESASEHRTRLRRSANHPCALRGASRKDEPS